MIEKNISCIITKLRNQNFGSISDQILHLKKKFNTNLVNFGGHVGKNFQNCLKKIFKKWLGGDQKNLRNDTCYLQKKKLSNPCMDHLIHKLQ